MDLTPEQRNSPTARTSTPNVPTSSIDDGRTHIPGSRPDQPYQPREATAATASQASGSRSIPYRPRGTVVPGSTGNRHPTYQPRGTAHMRGSNSFSSPSSRPT